ncbi:cupin domain-containing protein [Phenylobacterium montanum]|uniref:DUF861 domain-containing protein n=1 Tax=Phenylobacterium montanum TaxID=2823693 RepID=A0A975FWE0_9CAUL|nr:cupin domain-containing protein [Caulobacter sp. S6]QUD86630.1 DUF861 domain-containing protein [Caulobacter sp. S6]
MSPTDLALQPAPIHPDWVLEGAPSARYRILADTRDHGAQTLLWDCTAGVFNWFYDVDETIHILEGGMLLTDGTGTRRVKAGDVVFFPAGSKARWEVETYVRKVAVIHHPLPAPLGFGMRVWRKLTRRNIGHATPTAETASASPQPEHA